MKNNRYKDLLSNRNYTKDLAAALINRFGDSIDAIASSWIVYEITGKASWSAVIYALNQLPSVFITPLAGPLVEQWEKKKVMVLTDVIRAICVGIMATGLLFGFLSAPLIAVLTLVISTAEAFRVPAGTAMMPMLVKKEEYAHAVSLSQSLSSIVQLIGMGAAAVIIALIGTAGAIYVDMATFLLSALLIFSMRLPDDHREKGAGFSTKVYLQDLKAGFLYCASKRTLVTLSILILFLNGILVPLNSLQTPMVQEIFSGSPLYLSVLGVAVTISMLLGSVVFPMISERLSGKIFLTLCAFGIAVFYVGIILLQPLYGNPIIAVSALAILTGLLGFCVSLGSMYINVEMLKVIDPEYLARAASIGNALACAIIPVTAFAVSGSVGFLGVSGIFMIAGVVSVICLIFIASNRSLNETEQTVSTEGV